MPSFFLSPSPPRIEICRKIKTIPLEKRWRRVAAKANRMSILRTSALLLLLPLSVLAQANLDLKPSNKIQFADQFPGADACLQIQNAIAALPVNGGAVDAPALLLFFTRSLIPFAPILSKPPG